MSLAKRKMEEICAVFLATNGARRNVIMALTNLTDRKARQIIKESAGKVVKGKHIVSSEWFMKEPERMAEARLFLNIIEAQSRELPRAVQFINAFNTYSVLLGNESRMDINYAFLATQLAAEKELVEKECCVCHLNFLTTEKHYNDPDGLNGMCHVCKRRGQFFCIDCFEPLPSKKKMSLYKTIDTRCASCKRTHKLETQRKRKSQKSMICEEHVLYNIDV